MSNIKLYQDCQCRKSAVKTLILIAALSLNKQTAVLGQEPVYQIRGTVKDFFSKPVAGASVVFMRLPDSSVVGVTSCDTSGRYIFTTRIVGSYLLSASATSYKTVFSLAQVLTPARTNLFIPFIMERFVKELTTIELTALQRSMTVNKGKLVYNIEQSPGAAGSSAFELLMKMPGIAVDGNETLLLKGLPAVTVMLDGKLTYMSSQQLANMLKSMNADNISRIEIINTPSAQFDAAGNAGIINIITRKSNKQGYAANINAGITAGRYLLNAEGFTGNIKTKHYNFFGNAGYNFRHSDTREINQQVINAGNELITLDRDGNNPHKSYYYNYKTGVDVYITEKQQVGVVYSGSTDNWSKDAQGTTYLRDKNGTPQSMLISRNFAKEPYYNNVVNLNYKYNIDTAGSTITADADYISYRNNSDGYISSTSYSVTGIPLQPYQQLNIHQPSNIDIRSFKTDLIYPVHSCTIKAGIKYALVTIDNNFRYDSLINNAYAYAPSLSDNFVYKERIAAAYASAEKQWKKFGLDAGVRIEHTYSNGNALNTGIQNTRRYTTLFPFVTISLQSKDNTRFDFSVSRRINRPNYATLNPVRYFSDRYAYYSGNPALTAEKSWIAALSFTALGKYIFTLQYRRASDFISQSARIDTATGVLVTSPINFSHSDRTEAQFVIPSKLTSFWGINTYLIISYTNYPIGQRIGYKSARRVTADIAATQTFTLPGNWVAELTTRYTSPELYGIYLTRYSFSFDGGFKKTLLQKKLDLRFAFADLFHTQKWWGTSLSDAARYSYTDTPYSRRFSLSFMYHIGGKIINNKAHQTDEQQRL